jgi:hypothetical protein
MFVDVLRIIRLFTILAQESRIMDILKRPFKIPIPGYDGPTASGTLGMRRVKVRGPLWPPDADGAVVLYAPPELSVTDKLNAEIVYVFASAVVLLTFCSKTHPVHG